MAEQRKRKGARRSRHEWQGLLGKYDRSGLAIDAFCRREAISPASLYRWRSLLSDGIDAREVSHAEASHPPPAFVDLGPLNSAASRPSLDLTLDLGDGLILHLVRH